MSCSASLFLTIIIFLQAALANRFPHIQIPSCPYYLSWFHMKQRYRWEVSGQTHTQRARDVNFIQITRILSSSISSGDFRGMTNNSKAAIFSGALCVALCIFSYLLLVPSIAFSKTHTWERKRRGRGVFPSFAWTGLFWLDSQCPVSDLAVCQLKVAPYHLWLFFLSTCAVFGCYGQVLPCRVSHSCMCGYACVRACVRAHCTQLGRDSCRMSSKLRIMIHMAMLHLTRKWLIVLHAIII